MHKCTNCGNEFDSKFCPECGTEWKEKKTCPRCGATVGSSMKFCGDCGFSFQQQQIKEQSKKEIKEQSKKEKLEERKHSSERKKSNERKKSVERSGNGVFRLYLAMGYVPLGLLVLFAVLLFPFYTVSVADMNYPLFGDGFLSSFFGSTYSYGNVYNIGVSFPELNATMIALIVIAALTAVIALAAIITRFVPVLRDEKVVWDFSISDVITFASILVYITFIIIGIVILLKVPAIDEGTGTIESGALPILLVTLGVIFLVLAVTAYITLLILSKVNPKFKTDVIRIRQQKENERHDRLRKFYDTHDRPVPPDIVDLAIGRYDRAYYKMKQVEYKHADRMYDKGREGTPSKALVWLDMHRVLVGFVLALLLVGILLTAVLVPIYTNIFRVDNVKEIQLGYTQAQVKKILGEPYRNTSTDEVWRYYSSDYSDILNKLSKNRAAQEKTGEDDVELFGLLKEEDALITKLNKLTHKYIEVRFDGHENDDGEIKYNVSGILFDNEHCNTKSKNVKSAVLVNKASLGYYLDYTSEQVITELIDYDDSNYLAYECKFSGGGFFRSVLQDYTYKIYGNNVRIEWSDDYGQHFDTRTNIVKVGSVSADGVWTTDYNSVVSLSLPNSVTIINNNSFVECGELQTLQLGRKVSSVSSGAFNYCGKLKYEVQDGLLYLSTYLVGVSDKKITSASIRPYTRIIADGAFWDCRDLNSVDIPNSVTSIGNNAFCNCKSLTSAIISNRVASIGGYAFRDCSSLTIYCEASEKPNGWSNDWNSSNCPVVWDCKNNIVQ